MIQQSDVAPRVSGVRGPIGSDGGTAIPHVGFVASAGLGSLLGMRHALEPDHLAAVTTLMTGERTSAKGGVARRVLGAGAYADAC